MKCSFKSRYFNMDRGELIIGRVYAEAFLTWSCDTDFDPMLTNRYMKTLSGPGRAGGEP